RYEGGDLRARAASDTLAAADFRLHKDSYGKGKGAGGRDLGADVDNVGPGKAYAEWKKTPAYETWLAATGQTTPFVVMAAADKAEPKFSSLADAVANAKSGDTVEIRGNGPFLTPKLTILDRRALVIRAGAGFEPVLQPDGQAWEKKYTYLLGSNG